MKLHRLLRPASSGPWAPPLDQLPGDLSALLYFGPSELLAADSGPVAELLARAPAPIIIGCSTAGSILDHEIHDDAFLAVGIRLERSSARAACVHLDPAGADTGASSRAAGARLARELAGPDLRHLLVLSDGLVADGAALSAGLRENLPTDVGVTGGLAGDGPRFRDTRVGLGRDIGPGRVVALGFYGPALRIAHGTAGGWSPFGPERLVTRSEGTLLHSLDHEPALDLYRRYLGPRAAELPAAGLLFPLQLLPDRPGESGLIRTLLAIDESARTVTFAGPIPQGRRVRLMQATRDSLVGAAESGPGALRLADSAGDTLALAVSCVGRRSVLGQRCPEELELAAATPPPGSVVTGFYSYGEFAPSGGFSACELHNQTLVLTLLGEA